MKKILLLLSVFLCFNVSGQLPIPGVPHFYEPLQENELLNYLISDWALDEISGIVYDSNGNHNGTNNGALTNQAGKIGSSYLFSSGQYISFGNITGSSGDRTFSAWIYLNSLSNDAAIFSKWGAPDNLGDFLFQIDVTSGVSGNNNVVGYVIDMSSSSINNWLWIESSNNSITTGQWNHIAVTHEWGSSVKIYVNGIDDTAFSRNPTFTISGQSSYDVRIGQSILGTSKSVDGRIDQVNWWERVLLPSEVYNLYISELYYIDFAEYLEKTIASYWGQLLCFK